MPLQFAAWEARFEVFLKDRLESADPAHDLAHVKRVVANARRIAHVEGARLEIVLPAAWLHDCVVVPKNSPHRSGASREAADAATAYLTSIEYPAEILPAIGHAIEAHSFSAGTPPASLEARVVQDADRLDALGAVGVARCLMLGGSLRTPLYHPGEPLPETREPDDSKYVIDHFFTKLLRLQETMQTETGRHEALSRTAFLREFLDQLGSEIPKGDGVVQNSG